MATATAGSSHAPTPTDTPSDEVDCDRGVDLTSGHTVPMRVCSHLSQKPPTSDPVKRAEMQAVWGGINGILMGAGVRFHIEWGTLLAWERECDWNPFDHDLDIAIYASDRSHELEEQLLAWARAHWCPDAHGSTRYWTAPSSGRRTPTQYVIECVGQDSAWDMLDFTYIHRPVRPFGSPNTDYESSFALGGGVTMPDRAQLGGRSRRLRADTGGRDDLNDGYQTYEKAKRLGTGVRGALTARQLTDENDQDDRPPKLRREDLPWWEAVNQGTFAWHHSPYRLVPALVFGHLSWVPDTTARHLYEVFGPGWLRPKERSSWRKFRIPNEFDGPMPVDHAVDGDEYDSTEA